MFKKFYQKRHKENHQKLWRALSDLEAELIQFELAIEQLQFILGEHSTEYLCLRFIEHAERLRARWTVAWESI